MKRTLTRTLAVLLTSAALVGAFSSSAFARAEYDPVTDVHPVRLIAYPGHAIGMVLDYVIFRPIHYVVSLPGVSTVVGHKLEDGIDRSETNF